MHKIEEYANEYIHQGYKAFPCEGKRPRIPWRNLTLEQCRGIDWSPDDRIGIVIPHGVIVLDLDRKPDVDGLENLDSMTPGDGPWATAQTNSLATTGGGGLHLWFKCPDDLLHIGTGTGRLPPGVDVRANGRGYVVVPPSIHASGRSYEWVSGKDLRSPADLNPLPDWIAGLLREGQTDTGIVDPGPQISREQLRALLALIPPDEYEGNDNWFPVMCAAYNSTDGEGKDDFFDWWLEIPRADPNDVDARRRWDSLGSGTTNLRCTVGTLFDAVKRWGLDTGGIAEKVSDEIHAEAALDLLSSDPLPEVNPEAEEDQWGHLLAYGSKGKIRHTENNLITIMQHHAAFQGVLGYNTRSATCCLLAASPFDASESGYPREIHPSDVLRVVMWFSRTLKIDTTVAKIDGLLKGICMDSEHAHQFDPFKDYLNTINWDGIERLDTYLVDAAGVEDTPYIRAVCSKILISAVARTYEPGCKVDSMPILVGEQGIGKSTLFRALLPDPQYFSDHMPNLADKDAKAQIHGLVFLEIGELEAFGRADTTAIKNFITVPVDRFRPPYGRAPENFPRTCVFVGTTNADDFLRDVTGARRFWPIDVPGEIDVLRIKSMRDQLWAEAVMRYNIGESWWLEGGQIESQIEVAEFHRERIPYEEIVAAYLRLGAGEILDLSEAGDDPRFIAGRRMYTTVEEILGSALRIPVDRRTPKIQTEVSKSLRALGWNRNRKRIFKRRSRVYVAPDNWHDSDDQSGKFIPDYEKKTKTIH